MKALILAGGSGTRLWPLSRKNYPKQFLKLNNNTSLLQETMERLLHVFSPEDIIVVTNSEYKFHVINDVQPLFPLNNIILEPVAKNTAPAIALGIKYCLEKLGCGHNEVLFVSPSDHVIKPAHRFAEYVKDSQHVAHKGAIVTFGIKPTRPETGYGYIQARGNGQRADGAEYFVAERFTEKPDIETAQRYIDNGNYYWNSGMFAFSIGTMMDELAHCAPDISTMLDMSFDELVARFDQMPNISIDYAVAEKTDNMAVLPLDLYWNDIGSWDSLYDVAQRDTRGNVTLGCGMTIDTQDTLIISDKRLISTIGIHDCLIVDTDDAVLVVKREEAQKVKELVQQLQKEGRKEASEHCTTHRPWGSYTVLEEGERYKIKKIVVNPGARLSLQKHLHRAEHWVVINGTAKSTIDGRETLFHESESAYIPKATLHRLENPGETPLEIIEVQNGEYVGEDDIVRIDDAYGRHTHT
jgi:mannose-1-phosphate guanylyltransferase/mannose-6-phosphate isomerase